MLTFRMVLTISCAGLLFLWGCSDSTGRTGKTVHSSLKNMRADEPLESHITKLSTLNDKLFIELPIGSQDGVDEMTLLRVYTSDKTRIKAEIKISEIVGEHSAIAHIIGGLFDLNDPLTVNDPVIEIRNLGIRHGGQEIERAIREEEKRIDRESETVQKRFLKLREHYERRLDEIVLKYDQEISTIQKDHTATVAELQKEHSKTLTRREAEHRADIALVKTTLGKDSRLQINEQQRAEEKRFITLTLERDKLESQTSQLLREQERLHKQIEKLTRKEIEMQRKQEEQLRAEVESREILEARLNQIEGHLSNNQHQVDNILTNDENRNETVLERLTRITTERDTALQHKKLLTGQLEQAHNNRTLTEERITSMQNTINELKSYQGSHLASQQSVTTLQQELDRTNEYLDSAKIGRLEAERQLYDLISRILKLQANDTDKLEYEKRRVIELFHTNTQTDK